RSPGSPSACSAARCLAPRSASRPSARARGSPPGSPGWRRWCRPCGGSPLIAGGPLGPLARTRSGVRQGLFKVAMRAARGRCSPPEGQGRVGYRFGRAERLAAVVGLLGAMLQYAHVDPAAAAAPPDRKAQAAPNQLIVGFRPEVDAAARAQVVARRGGRTLK